uniref:Uncharacterized protein n=1 Tax=Setaria italica TaxID=4555 RepID=K4AA43_SETIT
MQVVKKTLDSLLVLESGLARVPVEGEDAERELPEAVVLAEHDANGAAEVLVPARHGGAERDGRPHPPRRHRPEHVLRPDLAAGHREVGLQEHTVRARADRQTVCDCEGGGELTGATRVRDLTAAGYLTASASARMEPSECATMWKDLTPCRSMTERSIISTCSRSVYSESAGLGLRPNPRRSTANSRRRDRAAGLTWGSTVSVQNPDDEMNPWMNSTSSSVAAPPPPASFVAVRVGRVAVGAVAVGPPRRRVRPVLAVAGAADLAPQHLHDGGVHGDPRRAPRGGAGPRRRGRRRRRAGDHGGPRPGGRQHADHLGAAPLRHDDLARGPRGRRRRRRARAVAGPPRALRHVVRRLVHGAEQHLQRVQQHEHHDAHGLVRRAAGRRQCRRPPRRGAHLHDAPPEENALDSNARVEGRGGSGSGEGGGGGGKEGEGRMLQW